MGMTRRHIQGTQGVHQPLYSVLLPPPPVTRPTSHALVPPWHCSSCRRTRGASWRTSSRNTRWRCVADSDASRQLFSKGRTPPSCLCSGQYTQSSFWGFWWSFRLCSARRGFFIHSKSSKPPSPYNLAGFQMILNSPCQSILALFSVLRTRLLLKFAAPSGGGARVQLVQIWRVEVLGDPPPPQPHLGGGLLAGLASAVFFPRDREEPDFFFGPPQTCQRTHFWLFWGFLVQSQAKAF